MKIAAYNVENLFERAKVFNEENSISKPIIKAVADLNNLFEKKRYSDNDKSHIIELLKELGLLKVDNSKYVRLRKIRGKLLKRPKTGAVEVVAEGREDWVGWVELIPDPVDEIAMMNTGRVFRDVNADIVAVVEAENRISLEKFSDTIIKKAGGLPYTNVMVIDGNDDRGIDVGVMTREGYTIDWMRSHIFDRDEKGKEIFSRDCPEYCIETPEGEKIWVLPNHFKSKFGGDNPQAKEKRKKQAIRTAEIYRALIESGHENVIVLGDLNDTPDSELLKPLLNETDLKDVSEHPTFDTGEFPGKGTYAGGNDNQKIDYLLLSPAMFARVKSSGLFRKGAWPGARKKWEVYPELTEEVHAASDHHLIWCEIE